MFLLIFEDFVLGNWSLQEISPSFFLGSSFWGRLSVTICHHSPNHPGVEAEVFGRLPEGLRAEGRLPEVEGRLRKVGIFELTSKGFVDRYGCGNPKIGVVKPPKWMVKIMENHFLMDDLGVEPIFGNSHIF